MGSCYIAQKLGSMLCDDLDGWDGGWEGGLRGRDIYVIIYILSEGGCIHIADSCCCIAKTNITL